MNSVWTSETQIPKFPKLNHDINAQVAVIGGGIAGILIAYMLKEKGLNCVLIEANRIGMGITKNTTAKITSQHGLIYNNLINRIGFENSKKYLMANELAIKKYKSICKNIECEFCELDSYVYSLNNRKDIENEVESVNSLGVEAKFVNETELPIKMAGAIKFKAQAQFNPILFLKEISKGLEIYEQTKVQNINGNTIETENGNIYAENIVVATHYPFMNKKGLYFVKMYQERSYVLGLEHAQKLNGIYIGGTENNSLSFRNYKNLLLLGGASNRTGKSSNNFDRLRSIARKLYPNSNEKYLWATQDCMTPDNIPYIGKYSPNTKNLFVATGFNKWGMTSSMVSAMILSDLITNKDNEFKDVFSPQRSFLNKKQTYINIGESFKNLLTPSLKRCSHMGCALKYNPQEDSWDCPCHGSRFTKEGNLIDNPAKRDL